MRPIVCLVVAVAWGTRAWAQEPVQAKAIYEIRWSGLPIGEMAVDLDDTAEHRAIVMQAQTTGLLDWIFTYRSTVSSNSERNGKGIVQTRFAAERVLNDEAESWSMSFGADGRLASAQIPGEVTADREPVPEALRHGPDPLSLLAETLAALQPGITEQNVTFDGKRAVKLDLACDEQLETVAPTADLPPAPAVVCALSGDVVAGGSHHAREHEAQEGKPERRSVKIWLAQNLLPGLALPVLIHGESRFGLVVARLVSLVDRTLRPYRS